MGEKFTSPLPLSAWGSDPTCRKIFEKTRVICQNTCVFWCISEHVGSDPEAERGRGEVNLSPILVLTLRPRVGGFYVSGRLWEAQFVVFYVSGRVWEAQSVVFYVSGRLSEDQLVVLFTLRAGPPTQLTFVRASF